MSVCVFLVEESKTFNENKFEITEKPKTFAESFTEETRKFETIKRKTIVRITVVLRRRAFDDFI